MTRPPLLKDPKWVSLSTADDVHYEHCLRIERLIEAGATPFNQCPGRCERDDDLETIDLCRPRKSPLLCNAACRIAQHEFERTTIEQIAIALSGVFGAQTFVTITRQEHIPVAALPSYCWDGLRQSVKRNLAKLKKEHDGGLAAIGRVDFDLAEGRRGALVARPHMHLVVVGPPNEHVRDALRPTAVQSSEGKRSILVRKVMDQGALRYALKCMLQGVPKGETAGPYRYSRERPPVAAELAFDRFLMRHTISEVLLLFGLRRYGDRLKLSRDLDHRKRK